MQFGTEMKIVTSKDQR